MTTTPIPLTIIAATLVWINPALAELPLKVYILAGQSNMDGQAKARTISAMRNDPEVADMYKDMTDKDGNPISVDGVYVSHNKHHGKLNASFGTAVRGPKIGPEYAFGIYMKKSTEEPILLIKTAWGGRNLLQHFRPPSAGDYELETDKWGNKTGHYYRRMIKEIKDVLAEPGKYHPDYNKEAGYEIAGFVWFQGYNDLIMPYSKLHPHGDSKLKDYSEYSRLMACFIRDVRNDLSAPDMKFVIGAIGIGGEVATEVEGTPSNSVSFQRAQAAPASMPEFKGNVAAVYTAKYWDHKLAAAAKNMKWVNKRVGSRIKSGKIKRGTPEEEAVRDRYVKEKGISEEEVELSKGVTDGEYHYLGSAKIYSRIGKGFAEAMTDLEKNGE